MKQFQQCRLRKGTHETTVWIEARGAKVGAAVEVLPEREFWDVVEVFALTLPEDLLKEHQKMNRNSLLSIEKRAPQKQPVKAL